MKTCIQTFRAGIEELLGFLTNTEHEAELIGLLLQPARQGSLEERERELLSGMAAAQTNRKRYIYSVAIVSLYGLLERLVDSVIEAFVVRVSGLVDAYEQMPAAIKRNHVPMSLDLVKALLEERYRRDTTHEEVIANLHSCLSGSSDFRVNGSAFVLHRGNISLSRVTGFLSSVGIDVHLRKVTLTRALSDFLTEREPERDVGKIADHELPALLQGIDDLVERRNEVSHGVVSIDDIESTELLKERCRFVAAYGEALYEVMLQEALKYEINLASVQSLGKPIAVYSNSIVCFEINVCQIGLGNVLAAATGNPLEPFRYSRISRLEIDHEPLPEIIASQPTRFAVEVSFIARDHFDYYVLANEVI